MHKTFEENIEFLKQCDTSFIADVLAERFHIENFSIDQPRPLNPSERFVGVAVTASYKKNDENEETNILWDVLDNNVSAGSVLVLGDAQGVMIGGDVIARYIKLSGAAAVVTDGVTRDKHIIKTLGIPYFVTGTSTNLHRYSKYLYRINEPVELFGLTVNHGDVLLGDEDGIVVIPGNLLDDVVYEAENVEELEARYDLAYRLAGTDKKKIREEIVRIGKLKAKMRDEQ